MNAPGKIAVLLLACCSFAAGSLASVPDEYQTIIDRNAFGLNPPPPPPDPGAQTNAPPPNVKLTGFSRMAGQLRAYFVIQPKDPKEQPQYLSLAENQREGVIEVVKISEEQGEVRIRNSNSESVLSLKDNKPPVPKLGPGVVPAPMPVAALAPPPIPGGAPPASPVYNASAPSSVVASYNSKVVAGSPAPAPIPGQPPLPPQPQPVMQPQTGLPAQNTAAPGAPQPPQTQGLRTIPTRTLRLSPSTP